MQPSELIPEITINPFNPDTNTYTLLRLQKQAQADFDQLNRQAWNRLNYGVTPIREAFKMERLCTKIEDIDKLLRQHFN